MTKFNIALTEDQYTALATKEPRTLYFIKDTGNFYKGDQRISNEVLIYDVLPATGIEGKIYIVKTATSINLHIWDGTKFLTTEQIALNNAVTDVEFTEATNVIKFTYADNTTYSVDLALESVFQNAEYTSATQTLTFTLVNGSTVDVSLADLVDIYSVGNSETVNLSMVDGLISANTKISADVGNILTIKADGLFAESVGVIWEE